MRRLALVATSLLVAAGLVAGASARDRAGAVGPVSCGTAKTFTYLFWPAGHPAIPSVGFPAFPVPHLELYVGAAGTYPGSAAAGFLSASGGGFAKTCKAAKLGRLAPATRPTTSTTTGAITCSFPRAPEHVLLKAGGGTQLLTVEPPKPGTIGKPQIEVSATIKAAGSTLAYDARVCKAVAAPKPPQLMKFSFDGLSASFNGGGPGWSVSFSGTSCGSDVRGPWSMTQTLSLNGTPVGQPGQRPIDLTSGSGSFTVIRNSDGSGSADAQFQVSAGPPAAMTLGVTLNGNYSGLSVNTAQAQISATPVASC
jgi:hypothetical protein